jgi:hypothetical protein
MISLFIYLAFSYIFMIVAIDKSKTIPKSILYKLIIFIFSPITLPIMLAHLFAFLIDRTYD